MSKCARIRWGKVGIAAVLLSATSAQAATLGFGDNFDAAGTGTTLPSPWTETVGAAGTASNYSIIAGPVAGNVLQGSFAASSSTTTGVPANASASVSLTDAPTNGFSISTDFRLESFAAGGSASTINFGLAALANNPNFSTGSSYRLLYTPYTTTGAGKLSLGEIGATGTAVADSSTGTLTAVNGLTGTITFTGTYNNLGHLTLNGTLVSGATTLTVTATDTSPLAGTLFGYRSALNAQLPSAGAAQQTSLDVRYDNFTSATVPEPGSLAAVGLGATALLARRRRR